MNYSQDYTYLCQRETTELQTTFLKSNFSNIIVHTSEQKFNSTVYITLATLFVDSVKNKTTKGENIVIESNAVLSNGKFRFESANLIQGIEAMQCLHFNPQIPNLILADFNLEFKFHSFNSSQQLTADIAHPLKFLN